MERQTNAMGARFLIVLPKRPEGEPSLLLGTTMLAAAMGGIFSLAMLLSVALSEPPARSLAASAPADAKFPHTSAVEAGAGNGGFR